MAVFDTSRARKRTVVLGQAAASSSKNRLLVASEAGSYAFSTRTRSVPLARSIASAMQF
jgi:hypothetical protein